MFGRENKKGQAIKIPERVIPKNENPFAHIEEAEMKKINEKLDEVIAPFKEEEEKAKSKVPAEYFSTAFAGKFQEMVESGVNDEKVIRDWLKISGGPSREVDLIDKHGNIVDVVPKLVNEIPTLDEKNNKRVKLMAQTIILEKEEANMPMILLEREAIENLSSMGKILMDATLAHKPNIENAKKFKEVVSKYSPKLSKEEIKEKLETPNEVNYSKYIID